MNVSDRKETNMISLSIFAVMFIFMYFCFGIFFSYGLHDPTYNEMQEFINEDLTNTNMFYNDTYTCHHFSRDVILHAREHGIKAGYVAIHKNNYEGHAIVCFDTTDHGLCFIEPQTDQIFLESELNHMVQQKKYDAFSFNVTIDSYTIKWWCAFL